MMYRLTKDPGDYLDSAGKRCTLLCCRRVRTHEGINSGWQSFETAEECLQHWGIHYSPIQAPEADTPNEESATP